MSPSAPLVVLCRGRLVTSQSPLEGRKWIQLIKNKTKQKTVFCTSIFEYTVGRYDQYYLT